MKGDSPGHEHKEEVRVNFYKVVGGDSPPSQLSPEQVSPSEDFPSHIVPVITVILTNNCNILNFPSHPGSVTFNLSQTPMKDMVSNPSTLLKLKMF